MKETQIAAAPGGMTVEGYLEGAGPTILFLHGGMDEGESWARVTKRLSARFRTVRLHRRTYRLDLGIEPSTSMAEEVGDVLAAAQAIGRPCLIAGHSSGGVIALEALAAAPSTFAGAIIYEPPVPVDGPVGGEALKRAGTALARKGPGTAMRVFFRDIVRYPAWLSWTFGALVGAFPSLRARVPRQLVDCEAIDRTGVRLDAYAGIGVPMLLLLGERSPAHLGMRTEALQAAIPESHIVRLAGQEHNAHRRAAGRVAGIVADFATDVLAPGRE